MNSRPSHLIPHLLLVAGSATVRAGFGTLQQTQVALLFLAAALLVPAARTAAAVRIWTGSSLLNRWTVPANWSPQGTPQDDESLIFPASSGWKQSVCDISSQVDIRSLSIQGAYRFTDDTGLHGRLDIEEGITVDPLAGATVIDRDVAFIADASFSSGGRTFLVSYTGGDGNDMILTVVPPPAQITKYLTLGDGTQRVQATGEPGRHYHFQRSGDLTSWHTLETVTAAPVTGSIVCEDLPSRASSRTFYRLLTSQQP